MYKPLHVFLLLILPLLVACSPGPATSRTFYPFHLDVLDATSGRPLSAYSAEILALDSGSIYFLDDDTTVLLPEGRYRIDLQAEDYAALDYTGLFLNTPRRLSLLVRQRFWPDWPGDPPELKASVYLESGRLILNAEFRRAVPLERVVVALGTEPVEGPPSSYLRTFEGDRDALQLSFSSAEYKGAGWLLLGARDRNGSQSWIEFPLDLTPRNFSYADKTFAWGAYSYSRGPARLDWLWESPGEPRELFERNFLIARPPASATHYTRFYPPGSTVCPADWIGCFELPERPSLELLAPVEGIATSPRPLFRYRWSPVLPERRLVLAVWRYGNAAPLLLWDTEDISQSIAPDTLPFGFQYYWGPVYAVALERTEFFSRIAVAVDEEADYGRHLPGPREVFDVRP